MAAGPRRSFPRARNRVVVAGAGGIVAGAALAPFAPWQVAVLGGWLLAAVSFVGWVLWRLWPLDPAASADHATVEDDSRALADGLVLAAAVASLAGIGVTLAKASSAHGAGKAAIIAVAAGSVAAGWAVVHTVFTLRYARLFFSEGGGVDFHVHQEPDYRDFAYLALTVGMTFQVSDTDVTSRAIRHTITRHALISYLFGAVVLAMSINIVASLLSH